MNTAMRLIRDVGTVCQKTGEGGGPYDRCLERKWLSRELKCLISAQILFVLTAVSPDMYVKCFNIM